MSLEKIPLIILYTVALMALTKPPNRLPPKNELVRSVKFDSNIYVMMIPISTFSMEFISAFGEILTILAYANPQWKYSEAIISTLVKTGGSAAALGVTPSCLVGLVLAVCGAIWRRWAYHEMGRLFVYRLSVQKDHELITTGPYSVVRHPGYCGSLISFVGWFFWVCSEGSWARQSRLWHSPIGATLFVSYAASIIVGAIVFAIVRMSREDEVMRKEFGKKWDEWAKKVPYAILPGIY